MKRLIILVLAVILIFTMTACGQNNLTKYKEAVEKTGNIVRGQVSYDFDISSNFNTEGLTNEEIKQINYFKSIESRVSVKYDEEKDMSSAMIYSNFGGIGFDFEVYYDGERAFMKMPVQGKYMDLSSMMAMTDTDEKGGFSEEDLYSFISAESIQAIKDKWVSLLNEEDVVAGKSTLLNTEDGEVKATLFTISLTNEQIKALVNDVLDILLEDEVLAKNLIQSAENSKEAITLEEIIEEIRKSVKDIEVNDFKYEVYIDIDSYIVESNLQATIDYSNTEPVKVLSQEISYKSQNWNIEKEQEFEFPELTDENTLDIENMDQGMPFMFDSYFNFDEMEGN